MIARILVTAVLMVTITVALAWWSWTSEHRPRHADAGIGALTVQQLCAQVRAETDPPTHEPITWPTQDTDATDPGSSYLPGAGTHVTAAPLPGGFDRSLPTMQRLLDRLHQM